MELPISPFHPRRHQRRSPLDKPRHTLSLSPLGGFNQSVALTCTGAPAMSTLHGAAVPVTVAVAIVARSHALTTPIGFTMAGNGKYLLIPMVFPLFAIAAAKANTQRQRSAYFNAPWILPVPIATVAALPCLALTQTLCGGAAQLLGRPGHKLARTLSVSPQPPHRTPLPSLIERT